LCGHC